MKEPGLVSSQQPTHRYKRGGHEHVAIPDYLERQFAVTGPNQVWCGDVTCIWTSKRWKWHGNPVRGKPGAESAGITAQWNAYSGV
ncbi:hypothetical protein [Escherichia coli]|uniref:hypothetical protein n=1 Tax=Escherichia coli TaxID=562 RepID=UPI003F4F266D